MVERRRPLFFGKRGKSSKKWPKRIYEEKSHQRRSKADLSGKGKHPRLPIPDILGRRRAYA